MTTAGAAMALPGFVLMNGTEIAFAGPKPSLNDNDVAVLQFLAAAELVESDLWGQYCELATNNPRYRNALQKIDESLPTTSAGYWKTNAAMPRSSTPFWSLPANTNQPRSLQHLVQRPSKARRTSAA
jgi:hypothetical protein